MKNTVKHKILSPLVIACALLGFSVVAVAADSTTTRTMKKTTNTDGSTVVEESTTTKVSTPAEEQQAKEDFKTKMKAQLDSISAQTKSLKEQAAAASSDAKVSLDKRIADLDQKRNEINAELDKASAKTGRAWTQFKSGVQKAVGELQAGYSEAKNEFSKSAASSPKEARDENDARKAVKENPKTQPSKK